MARHRPQTVCRYGADLVRLVSSIVHPGTELLHCCAKTNFAGPTKYLKIMRERGAEVECVLQARIFNKFSELATKPPYITTVIALMFGVAWGYSAIKVL